MASSCVADADGTPSLPQRYSHDERATVHILPSSSASPQQRPDAARVLLESTSTLRASAGTALPTSSDTIDAGVTPLPPFVLELLRQHRLRRLLIRVGDAASSSFGIGGADDDPSGRDRWEEERAVGPAGTSIRATFDGSAVLGRGGSVDAFWGDRYSTLLRDLLDGGLFPPCGAPLDSLRVRKHNHRLIVRPAGDTDDSGGEFGAEVEGTLGADGGTMCHSGIRSLLLASSSSDFSKEGSGWGRAASNGACPSQWGLFDSLFGASTDENHGDNAALLADLILRTSPDAAPYIRGLEGNGGYGRRNSIWIDVRVSSACFSDSAVEGSADASSLSCTVSVTKGVVYHVALPDLPPGNISAGDENGKRPLSFSIGDILLGSQTLRTPRAATSLRICPLSESSRISLIVPPGYDGDVGGEAVDGKERTRIVEDDLLRQSKGAGAVEVDLVAPWVNLYHDDNIVVATPDPSSVGISRTVLRPSGISNSGTFVTALRRGRVLPSSFDDDGNEDGDTLVRVRALDVVPGTLVKPLPHTLRMTLYEGGGAGDDFFVPPPSRCDGSNSVDSACAHFSSVRQTPVTLSDLPKHRLRVEPDGTIAVEREAILPPDSSLWMYLRYDPAFLPFEKFPADPNRGVDVAPSRATFTISRGGTEDILTPSASGFNATIRHVTLYSQSILVLPPVPDMSMPFNVISLSCTLWAFVLGSLMNLLVKRGPENVKRVLTGEKAKTPADKLKAKLRKLKRKIGSKFTKRKNVSKENEKLAEMKVEDKK